MPTMLDTKGRIADTGTQFDGLDRFEARVKVREVLAAQGRIVAEKRPYLHSVGHSERSGEPIEPRLSLQWWVKVESLAKAAGDAVRQRRHRDSPEEPRTALVRLGRRHARLVYLAPAVVGPPHSDLARTRRTAGLRRTRRGPARGLGAGPRRARHLVLVGAVAVLHPGVARSHSPRSRLSIRQRF